MGRRWPETRCWRWAARGSEAALALAEALLAEVPPGSSTPSYVSRSSVEPYVLGLKGEVLLRKRRARTARALLKDVQQRIRAVPGPDAWTEALFRLEDIARAAREAGDWELAAYTAEQMREHDPAYGGTQYALGRVAEKDGDAADAQAAYDEAVRLWRAERRRRAGRPRCRDARARRDLRQARVRARTRA